MRKTQSRLEGDRPLTAANGFVQLSELPQGVAGFCVSASSALIASAAR